VPASTSAGTSASASASASDSTSIILVFVQVRVALVPVLVLLALGGVVHRSITSTSFACASTSARISSDSVTSTSGRTSARTS
jgi:hypothetical protein